MIRTERTIALQTAAVELMEKLTPRQVEVAVLLSQGRRNKEIAAELGNSERTIEVHRGAILKTLDITSTAQLAVIVCRAGMLEDVA